MKYNLLILIILVVGILTACNEKPFPFELGLGFKIAHSDNQSFVTDSDNNILIFGDVTKYNFNSEYIIIKQKPVELLNDSLTKKYPLMSTQQINELVLKTKIRHYWIIDKKQKQIWMGAGKYSNVHGPYTVQAFLKKRVEFKMPDSLKFIDIYSNVKPLGRLIEHLARDKEKWSQPDTIGL